MLTNFRPVSDGEYRPPNILNAPMYAAERHGPFAGYAWELVTFIYYGLVYLLFKISRIVFFTLAHLIIRYARGVS